MKNARSDKRMKNTSKFISLILRHKPEVIGLSLDGVRKTTRYQNIEVEYLDSGWKKHRQKFSGWTAQIVQHEIDHFSGKII